MQVLERMSHNAVDDPCTLTNPNQPTVQDVKTLFKRLLRRLIFR
jgi:alcohol dehydrogenase class IV